MAAKNCQRRPFTLILVEPCADVIVLVVARRSILVGGGRLKKWAAARCGRWSYLISHRPTCTCFKRFSSNNFCYQGMYIEQLFLRLSVLKFEKKILLIQAAKPSRLKFNFQVEVPTTVNELTLSAYNSVIEWRWCEQTSPLGVAETVKQRKVWWCAGCRCTKPWTVKRVGYFKNVTRFLILLSLCVFCREHAVNCTITSRREV